MTFRLLTYNILKGGTGREALIAQVINSCTPDLVLLQEATDPGNVERLAQATGMADWNHRFAQGKARVERASYMRIAIARI